MAIPRTQTLTRTRTRTLTGLKLYIGICFCLLLVSSSPVSKSKSTTAAISTTAATTTTAPSQNQNQSTIVPDFFEFVSAQTDEVFNENQEMNCTVGTSDQVKSCLQNIIFQYKLPVGDICPHYQEMYDCNTAGFQRCSSSSAILHMDDIQLLYLRIFNERVRRNGCSSVQDKRNSTATATESPSSPLTTQTYESFTIQENATLIQISLIKILHCPDPTREITACFKSIVDNLYERCELDEPAFACYQDGLERCLRVAKGFTKGSIWHGCSAVTLPDDTNNSTDTTLAPK